MPRRGLEPPRLSAPDPKSGMSTIPSPGRTIKHERVSWMKYFRQFVKTLISFFHLFVKMLKITPLLVIIE